jgi:hypothetical protein
MWSSLSVNNAAGNKIRNITQQEGIHIYAIGKPYTSNKASTQKDSSFLTHNC